MTTFVGPDVSEALTDSGTRWWVQENTWYNIYYSTTEIQAASEQKEASIQLINGCRVDETAKKREARPQYVRNRPIGYIQWEKGLRRIQEIAAQETDRPSTPKDLKEHT